MLLEIPWNGSPRKVVVHANRNGFFYILDRETGKFLKATQLIDNLTWASGIDDNGKPGRRAHHRRRGSGRCRGRGLNGGLRPGRGSPRQRQ